MHTESQYALRAGARGYVVLIHTSTRQLTGKAFLPRCSSLAQLNRCIGVENTSAKNYAMEH